MISNHAYKHAVTSLSTGETYTYDANGNMITRVEGGLTYNQVYDAENRLISVTVNSQTTQFVYDGDGNMVKKINPDGSRTIYVGGIYEVDKASGGSVTRTVTYYPAGGAMRINSTLYFILKDHLGSASVVTNASGVTVGETRYYPYGETRLTTGTIYTDKLFTGQREMAGLGIYHYGARFFSPRLGRFLSADTMVPNLFNPQDLNRFSYVRNNPVRYTDPTGHMQASDDYYCYGCTLPPPPPIDPPDCSASWPWMCSNDPSDNDPEETLQGEASGTSAATPAPTSWCGGGADSPYCPGFLLNYAQDTDPVDGWVISANGVGAAGTFLVMFGFDVVCTTEACVLFVVGPSNLGAMPPLLPSPIRSVYNASTPQLGGSLTVAPITSQILREKPGAEGIIDAWSGDAMQEGYSLFLVTSSASSSVDPDGTPNFQTTSSGGGFSVGFTEIIFEYHQYMTYAKPIWPPPK